MLLAGATTSPLAIASWYLCAWARKPTDGLLWKILMKPAAVVQISSHTVGSMVTQA
ncbi:hypothetical protein D3C87_2129470 [compost metagenome]